MLKARPHRARPWTSKHLGTQRTAPFRTDEPKPVRYSGAIMADSDRKARISAWKMRIYGFAQVKVASDATAISATADDVLIAVTGSWAPAAERLSKQTCA